MSKVIMSQCPNQRQAIGIALNPHDPARVPEQVRGLIRLLYRAPGFVSHLAQATTSDVNHR
jgi:hypothetical protein